MDTSSAPTPDDRLPVWLDDALAVLSAQRRLVATVALGLMLVAAIVALVAPSVLPPTALVGAAVGVSAALLATAVVLAKDASDLVVRGDRHVRAAGGAVDVRVGRQHDDIDAVVALIEERTEDDTIRVALAPASRRAGVPGPRAAAVAEALARSGRRVLLTDLTRSATPAAGLSDVISGSKSLTEAVRFEQDVYLARLAVGSDPDVAIEGFAEWSDGLPSDLGVLIAALPPLAEPGVLAAAGAVDLTLLLVEVDRTERVDLIASLDAVDAAGLDTSLVLVDPAHVPAAAPAPTADEDVEDTERDEVSDDAVDDADVVATTADTDDTDDTVDTDEDDLAAAAPTAAADEDADNGSDTATVPGTPTDDLDPEATIEIAMTDLLGDDPDGEDDDDVEAASDDWDDAPFHPTAWGDVAAESEEDATDEGPSDTATGEDVPDEPAEPVAATDLTADSADDEVTSEDATDDAPADAPADDPPADDAPADDAPRVAAETPVTGWRRPTRWKDQAAGPVATPPPAPATNGSGTNGAGTNGVGTNGAASVTTVSEDAPAAQTSHAPADDAIDALAPGTDQPTPAPTSDEPEVPAFSGGPGLDPAALEVARTSAALNQLAQQLWERDRG